MLSLSLTRFLTLAFCVGWEEGDYTTKRMRRHVFRWPVGWVGVRLFTRSDEAKIQIMETTWPVSSHSRCTRLAQIIYTFPPHPIHVRVSHEITVQLLLVTDVIEYANLWVRWSR